MSKHLPSFVIVQMVEGRKLPRIQGWATRRDAKSALSGLKKSNPNLTFVLEDE